MLDRIPAGRRVAVIAAHKLARDLFNDREGLIDELQRSLTRITDDSNTLCVLVIERLAAVQHAGSFGTEDEGKAIEALGALACACARLCEVNAISIRPIFDLARVYTRHESTAHVQVMITAGQLAAVVREGCDRIRITDAIGILLAKAIDEVEIVHELSVKLPDVFEIVARETLAGKKPSPAQLEEFGLVELQLEAIAAEHGEPRKARALVALQGGLDDLATAEQVEDDVSERDR
jgi:hypothetical protein